VSLSVLSGRRQHLSCRTATFASSSTNNALIGHGALCTRTCPGLKRSAHLWRWLHQRKTFSLPRRTLATEKTSTAAATPSSSLGKVTKVCHLCRYSTALSMATLNPTRSAGELMVIQPFREAITLIASQSPAKVLLQACPCRLCGPGARLQSPRHAPTLVHVSRECHRRTDHSGHPFTASRQSDNGETQSGKLVKTGMKSQKVVYLSGILGPRRRSSHVQS
jgi:hypothetical protein